MKDCMEFMREFICIPQLPLMRAIPHFPLLMLGNQVAVEVFQGHLGHGHSLFCVVTH